MAIYHRGANSPDTVGWGGAMLGNPLFWITVIAVPATALLIARTPLGLRIRAAGDSPEGARAAGVDVDRARLAALAIGGALAGLGGAQLALSNRSFYTEITGGRGYVALAAVIMGRWRPLAAAAACLCFGAAEVLQFQLQSMDIGIPSELARLTPYAVTLLVLVGVVGRSTPPRALGKPAD
jgi:simple sugar transport system permease protein